MNVVSGHVDGTSLRVLQQSQNIPGPAVHCKTKVLVQLGQLDHKMRVSIHYKRDNWALKKNKST